MTSFQYWSLNPPRQWQAGTVGADQRPFYFSCADCGAKEPEIAGIISTDGTYNGIGVLPGDHGFMRPAMFCRACFDKRITDGRASSPTKEAAPRRTLPICTECGEPFEEDGPASICPECIAENCGEDEYDDRHRDEDDGRTYADPRDEIEERRNR